MKHATTLNTVDQDKRKSSENQKSQKTENGTSTDEIIGHHGARADNTVWILMIHRQYRDVRRHNKTLHQSSKKTQILHKKQRITE